MSNVNIHVDTSEIDAFAATIEHHGSPEKFKPAVTKSTFNIERQAKQNVTANGSVKTGHLRRSIQGQVNGLTGIVHTSNLKYAPWVEKGTRPHTIRPKSKKFLYWRGAAHPVKIVHHPGGSAKPYLIPAFEQEKPKFLQNLKDCIKW